MSKQRAFASTPPMTRDALLRAEHGPLAASRRAAPLRVALVFPNSYAVGMSSLGFQIVYQLLDAHPDARPERFFLDTLDAGSIETGSPLRDFDLAAFSASFELDGPNILEILERGGVPLFSRERDEHHPLILLGGVLATLNRLPLYPFIDAFTHGEAETILPALIATLAQARARRISRGETLDALAEVPGIEITGHECGMRNAECGIQNNIPRTTHHASCTTMSLPAEATYAPLIPHSAFRIPHLTSAHPASAILTPHAEFANMGLIDLARGCRNRCTFCWIGHHSPPYRVRPAAAVLEAAAALAPFTDRIGLVASAVGAHPEIDEICAELMARGMKISFSSLRVEEVTETMLRALAAGGQRGATIAPEAGSPRVRRLLGKRLSDDRIFAAAERIFGLGMESLKLYFMIGVPTETDDEALEIAVFVERIREIMLRWARPRGRIGSIGVNLGIYVPKPGLPLSKLEQVPFETVKARLKIVTRRLAGIPNVNVAASSPDEALAQGILAMGGIETADYLLLARRHRLNWRAANREWMR